MNPHHNQGGFMRKIIAGILMVIFLATPVFADMADTQAEEKMCNYLKQIHNGLEGARENANRQYNKAKNYMTSHSGQISTGDKAKLNGLQADITNVLSAINTLLTEIETDFPGLME